MALVMHAMLINLHLNRLKTIHFWRFEWCKSLKICIVWLVARASSPLYSYIAHRRTRQGGKGQLPSQYFRKRRKFENIGENQDNYGSLLQLKNVLYSCYFITILHKNLLKLSTNPWKESPKLLANIPWLKFLTIYSLIVCIYTQNIHNSFTSIRRRESH